MHRLNKVAMVTLVGLVGCASDDTTGDGRDDSFTTDGKLDGFQCTAAEAAAILTVANTASLNTLKNDVGLSTKAADNIVAVRKGDDEVANTSDDEEFGSLAQLDAVPYIGPTAFAALLQYVHDADLVDDTVSGAGTWSFDTVANGSYANAAIAPNKKIVMTFQQGDDWKLQLANGTLVPLPDEITPTNSEVQPVVDAAGVPHVFWPQRTYVNGRWDLEFKHVSYRNGQLAPHDPIDVDWLRVDHSPDGKLFALARKAGTYSLLTVATNGSTSAETLWSASSSSPVGLTVAADGYPAFAEGSGGGPVRHARRGPNGWTKLDVSPSMYVKSVATTGGANAVVFMTTGGALKAYRQSGTAFTQVYSKAFSTSTTYGISTATDVHGTAHACYLFSGNAFHLAISTTGEWKEQSLGNAENCRLAADSDGKLHAFVGNGSVFNYGTYQ